MNKYVVWFEQAEIGIRFDDSKKFLIAIFDLHLFTDENPVIDFNGIDPTFLDATDVKRINELSKQEKSVYITKVIECCQYLHNRAIQQECEDGTIHCVWNIQVWCKYGYWFAKSPKVENGCQLWKGPVTKKSRQTGLSYL